MLEAWGKQSFNTLIKQHVAMCEITLQQMAIWLIANCAYALKT